MENKSGNTVANSFEAELNRSIQGTAPANNQNTQNTATEMAEPTYELAVGLKKGEKVTGKQLKEEYEKVIPDYTRISQENAKLKEQLQSMQSVKPASPAAPQQPNLSTTDQAVLDELKRLGVVFQPTLDQEFSKREQTIVGRAADKAVEVASTQAQLRDEVTTLEKAWDGTEGKPLVKREKLVEWLDQNAATDQTGRKIYPNIPLETVAKIVYNEDFIKYEARKLTGEGKANLPQTEGNGAGVTTPPPPPRYNFNDGSAKRALETMFNIA